MSGEGAPDPANPHPDKRVPAIIHDSEQIAESVAIVAYLTDAFPAAGLGRARGAVGRSVDLTWLAWYAAEMEPAMFAAMGGELSGNPMKRRNYYAAIARIEGALADSPYLMGEAFTGADLPVSSAVNFARRAFPESLTLDAYARPARPCSARLRSTKPLMPAKRHEPMALQFGAMSFCGANRNR